ncbi:hypothetical protein ACHAXS_000487 [Conticribra weissflogii]
MPLRSFPIKDQRHATSATSLFYQLSFLSKECPCLEDLKDIALEVLPSGVIYYKHYKGKADTAVRPGNKEQGDSGDESVV